MQFEFQESQYIVQPVNECFIRQLLYQKQQHINRNMGSQQSGNHTSIINSNFLKSLSSSTPLKNLDHKQTEVHQIACLSPEHHQIMLEKIRIKKNYDCPYILRIIDSHTLQSKNFCSTIIKTYIVVEKPESLAQEIQHRILVGFGFQQAQLWTLIYSCCMAGSFLLKNNVGLLRLNPSKVFVDLKGGIKINDPDFSEGSMNFQRVPQPQYIESLYELCKQLMTIKKSDHYSANILELLRLMNRQYRKFSQIQKYIKENYLNDNKTNILIEGFSSTKKNRTFENSKQKPRKLSGRKGSIEIIKSHRKQTSQFTNYNSLASCREQIQQKQNMKSNQISRKAGNHLQLFSFKDSLKDMQSLDTKQISLESHLFPRKALFGQRKKAPQKKKQNITSDCSRTACEISRSSTTKQILTRESHSLLVETDPSLDGSQLLNMISSYQVDQETFVREVCQEQSQYFLQLMNHRKMSSNSGKYQQF